MYIALCLSLLLTFSYKIIEIIIKIFSPRIVKYSLYFWAGIILILGPFLKWNYIYTSPSNIIKVMPVFLILLIANYIVSRYSGYSPVGRFNTINFITTKYKIHGFCFCWGNHMWWHCRYDSFDFVNMFDTY